MPMSSAETEIDVLEAIHQSTGPLRQRDIAQAIGLSLGMTNAVLKRLAKKGWLSVRKVNSRNIQYVVSPKGMEEIAGRSYRYLRRTISNIVRYKEAIEKLVREAKERGCTEVVLVGESDLEFIVEHACLSHGVRMRTVRGSASPTGPIGKGSDALVILSESIEPSLSSGDKLGGGGWSAVGRESAESPGEPAGTAPERAFLRGILTSRA